MNAQMNALMRSYFEKLAMGIPPPLPAAARALGGAAKSLGAAKQVAKPGAAAIVAGAGTGFRQAPALNPFKTVTAAAFGDAARYGIGHTFLNPMPGSGYGAMASGLMTEKGDSHAALRGGIMGAVVGGILTGAAVAGKALYAGGKHDPELAPVVAISALVGALGGALGGAHAGHGIGNAKEAMTPADYARRGARIGEKAMKDFPRGRGRGPFGLTDAAKKLREAAKDEPTALGKNKRNGLAHGLTEGIEREWQKGGKKAPALNPFKTVTAAMKEAVSTEWIANKVRSGMQAATPARGEKFLELRAFDGGRKRLPDALKHKHDVAYHVGDTVQRLGKHAADLTPAARAKLPGSDFAVKAKKSNTGHEAYPIEDRAHARSALGFAKMHGDAADLAAVRRKIEAKYPDMLKKSAEEIIKEAGSLIARMKGFGKELAENQPLKEKVELAGLGALAAPVGYEFQKNVREGDTGGAVANTAELGGLGILAAPAAAALAHSRH